MKKAILFAAMLALAGAARGQGDGKDPASLDDFPRCDGFGAPNERGDGMTRQATGFLGLFVPQPGRGDGTARTPRFSADGIAACDSALGQPRLAASYHLRRASLLRARAIHRMSLEQYAAALQDLRVADEEGRLAQAPLYDRSMGVGNNLLRAFALAHNAQSTEAAALTGEIRRGRPYSFDVARVSAGIALYATNDWARFRRELEEVADVHPQSRILLFFVMLEMGDYADAIDLRARIRLATPRRSYAGFTIGEMDQIHAGIFAADMQLEAATAFAYAAAGQDAEARARIARLRTRLERAGAELILRPDGSRPTREQRDNHAAIRARVPAATAAVDAAARLVRLLEIARSGDPEALRREAGEERLPADAAGLLIFRTLVEAAPDRNAELAPMIERFAAEVRNGRRPPAVTLADLYEAMPGAETENRIPRYGSARGFLGENTGNGFALSTDGPVLTVNYGGREATQAVVEEMALLRAADIAREMGQSRIAVLSRQISQRTVRLYSMYGGNTSPAGFAAEITFVPFNPGALPEDYRAFAERSVDVAAVIADLAPVYRPEPASGARRD